MLIVVKFGGTSLADNQRILAAAQRIAAERAAGNQVVAVVSAQGHTTDRLLELARSIHEKPPKRELDACLSTGEQISAALMAMALNSLGCDCISLTGPQAGLMTDSVHGDARVLGLRGNRIRRELEAGKAVIVTGFQGINGSGDTTTLGRGGSDTTAVALAAYLNARICRIYTDVDGVYDRDPRQCPDAKRFDTIGYEPMLQMARQGAQVLHDRCVELAILYQVPIQVLSSFRPGPGTLVTDTPDQYAQILPELF